MSLHELGRYVLYSGFVFFQKAYKYVKVLNQIAINFNTYSTYPFLDKSIQIWKCIVTRKEKTIYLQNLLKLSCLSVLWMPWNLNNIYIFAFMNLMSFISHERLASQWLSTWEPIVRTREQNHRKPVETFPFIHAGGHQADWLLFYIVHSFIHSFIHSLTKEDTRLSGLYFILCSHSFIHSFIH